MKSGYKLFFAYVVIGISIVLCTSSPVSAGQNTWYEDLLLSLNLTQNSYSFAPETSPSGAVLLGVNSTYDADITVVMDGWKTHNITLDTRSFVLNLSALTYHENVSGNITVSRIGRDPDQPTKQRHRFNVSYKNHNLNDWRSREWIILK